jgi:putative ABC transport system substrate-binding protein
MGMRRRDFIALIGSTAAIWPITTRAQDVGRTYHIGFFVPYGPELVGAFLDELARNGFKEGQNLIALSGGFNVRAEQIAKEAAALVANMPDVVFTGPDVYTRAIQKAGRSVSIVALSGDMVGSGLVASLSRPGGNTTGVSMIAPELDVKRQDILIEVVPGIHRMAALTDTTMSQNRPQHLMELTAAARARGVDLLIVPVTTRDQIVPGIDEAKKAGAQALNFLATPLFIANRRFVVEQAAQARLPAMYQWPEIADEGGLLAYGARTSDIYRQAARLVVKVLRGSKPADLPVEQPTKFELVINLKTAKALEISISPTLLATADEVIE